MGVLGGDGRTVERIALLELLALEVLDRQTDGAAAFVLRLLVACSRKHSLLDCLDGLSAAAHTHDFDVRTSHLPAYLRRGDGEVVAVGVDAGQVGILLQ